MSLEPIGSEQTILEARINGELTVVGGCLDVSFDSLDVYIKSLSLFYRPVPSLGNFDPEKWLSKQSLVLTRIRSTPSCHSTYSWFCIFKECSGVNDLTDFSMLSDVRLEIGRIRE